MLDIVTWRWKPMVKGYRSDFSPAARVNTMLAMVDRNYRAPYRFTCVTDDPKGIDPAVRILPLPEEFRHLRSPHGAHQPHCYMRVSAWGPWGEDNFGERFVSLDLDAVIARDMRPVWDREEECVMWADALSPNPYNGSMWLLKNGSRADIYWTLNAYVKDGHDPGERTKADGLFGSDQAWYARWLRGDRAATWNRSHGVYSWRVHMAPAAFGGVRLAPTQEAILRMRRGGEPPGPISKYDGTLPPEARVVFFHGIYDPWNPQLLQRFPWIKDNYKI